MTVEREKVSTGTPWVAVGQSTRGVSHERSGTPCQDDWYSAPADGGHIVLACADGAGSSKHSDIGARAAVKAAVDAVCVALRDGPPADDAGWQRVLRSAAGSALREVSRKASDIDKPLKELSCTLLLAIAGPTTTAAFQIGDGAIVQWSAEEGPIALTVPAYGEHINETFFLTAESNIATAQCPVWHGPPRPLAMFSDGLEMLALKMPKKAPVRRFFEPIFALLDTVGSEKAATAEIEALLGSERVRSKTDDDLTLVVAWPRPRGGSTTALAPERRAREAGAEAPQSAAQSALAKVSSSAPVAAGQKRASVPASSSVSRARTMSLSSRPSSTAPQVTVNGDDSGFSWIAIVCAFLGGTIFGVLGVWAVDPWNATLQPKAGDGNTRANGGLVPNLASALATGVPAAPPPPTPVQPVPFMGACSNSDVCGPFLRCIAHACARPFRSGEQCRGEDECALGLMCRNGSCTKKEKPGKVAAKGVCKIDADCTDDLLCVRQRCLPTRLSAGQDCENNEDCDDGLICAQARCKPEYGPHAALP